MDSFFFLLKESESFLIKIVKVLESGTVNLK